MNFEAHNEEIRNEMLKEIGLANIEDLFNHIPVKMKNLNLQNPLSEMNVQKELKSIAKKNKTDYISFIGGG